MVHSNWDSNERNQLEMTTEIRKYPPGWQRGTTVIAAVQSSSYKHQDLNPGVLNPRHLDSNLGSISTRCMISCVLHNVSKLLCKLGIISFSS